MTIHRYLFIVVALVGLGITTVAEHVERVRLGYEMRRLEQDKRRLLRERKARRLMWERMAAAETVAQRALKLELIDEAELEALPIADDRPEEDHP